MSYNSKFQTNANACPCEETTFFLCTRKPPLQTTRRALGVQSPASPTSVQCSQALAWAVAERVFVFVSDPTAVANEATAAIVVERWSVDTMKQRMVVKPTPICNRSRAATLSYRLYLRRTRSPHHLWAPNSLDSAAGGTLPRQLGS